MGSVPQETTGVGSRELVHGALPGFIFPSAALMKALIAQDMALGRGIEQPGTALMAAPG